MISIGYSGILAFFDRFRDPLVGKRLYYVAFALYSLAAGITITASVRSGLGWMDVVDDSMQVVALLLLFVKTVFSQSYSRRQAVTAACVFAVFAVSAFVCKNYTALWFAVLIIAGQDIDIRVVAGIAGATSLFILVFAVLGSSVGFLENVQIERGGSENLRNAMGFTHPNGFGETVAKICLALAVAKWRRLAWIDFAFFAVAAASVVIVADSRTFALAIVMIAVLSGLMQLRSDLNTSRRVVMGSGLLVAACFFMSLFFMVFYDPSNPVHSALNSALNTRLSLAHHYFESYSPMLFGVDYSHAKAVYMAGGIKSTFVVDNAFCQLVLRYGIVVTCVVAAALVAFFRQAVKEDYAGVAVVLVAFMALVGLSERVMAYPDFNILFVAFSAILYGRSLWSIEGGGPRSEDCGLREGEGGLPCRR